MQFYKYFSIFVILYVSGCTGKVVLPKPSYYHGIAVAQQPTCQKPQVTTEVIEEPECQVQPVEVRTPASIKVPLIGKQRSHVKKTTPKIEIVQSSQPAVEITHVKNVGLKIEKETITPNECDKPSQTTPDLTEAPIVSETECGLDSQPAKTDLKNGGSGGEVDSAECLH